MTAPGPDEPDTVRRQFDDTKRVSLTGHSAGEDNAAVWKVTREEIERRAGREITDTEAGCISGAISNSTVWECIDAAIEQVCGWPEENETGDQLSEIAGVLYEQDGYEAEEGR